VQSNDDTLSLDMLIGRIIDGEASLAQRERFEGMAADDPALWRVLALKQQDMSMLTSHLEPRLNAAEQVELPEVPLDLIEPVSASGSRLLRMPWWISVSGWAAMIALTMAWGYSANRGNAAGSSSTGIPAGQPTAVKLTPEEHLREYLQAPYVLNEMPPMLLDNQPLPDGRIAVSFLRRIVEVRYVDSPEDIPVIEGNEMSGPPTKLSKEPPPAFTPKD
jgi:hypothetical protein